ncbi:cytochrome P450 2A9 [Nephila pilipes]|uniref:Cytochrome P450 2A9 n=1 Tax=Nephila pilipes TaxID=299642 RepID=A0A8X6NM87_NEPPI|nr:cytochrome P450 2A9 [Nephila pilipes]
MDVTTLIIVALAIVLLSIWLTSGKRSKKELPGPTGLPIVGYIPFMTKKPYVKLTELSKTYGPVYKVRLGAIDIVVITDYDLIKEAFARDSFMGRPPDLPFELSEETITTGAFNGMPWKEQRRFSLHMLRDLGFGKTQMEEDIKEEILELLERMSAHVGKPTKFSYILAPSMSNNIASLVFGKRLKYNDPQRQRLDNSIGEIGRLAGSVSWQLFFPWLRKFLSYFNIGDKGKLVTVLHDVKEYCREEMDEHEKTLDPNNIRSFMDSYLIEIQKQSSDPNSTFKRKAEKGKKLSTSSTRRMGSILGEEMEEHEKTLDPNNIRSFMDSYLIEIQKQSSDPNSTFKKEVLTDLARAFFAAGSDTVRVTVDWMLLVSAAYPRIQKRIHAEIDEVIGPDRFPTWQDRLRMPFTEAAIIELMRWRTIVPLNIMRYTLQDTELNGYFIPKHTRILAVIWALDNDKKLWGNDVQEYKPERMLSEDGTKVVKPEHAIPFSVGKRSCPGKTLAEIEVFLYLVAILQKFEVSKPPGKELDLEGELGVSLQPIRQELCLKLRH